MHPPLEAEGHSYRDFLITRYLPLEELRSTLVELVHQPSGARVIQIANSDQENLFCLSFQTLPDSSNGVAHILEHTVLCGSKKYPVKDPFFSMNRRSLNTFMNAFTGQDFTCYPASSQVEKDFYNLLEVYLDAVFHPELKKLSFLQEGHRLQFSTPEDPTTPLTFQGVVYNEMKGGLASADSRLWKRMFQELYPDLPLAHNTGGDPQEIPNLSYEELLAFHENFYHPSRCLFFFYGNLPLAKQLDFLSEHALKGVLPLPPLPPMPDQARFRAPQKIVDFYPISKEESLEKKTIIAFGYLTAPISNQEELLALSLIDSLLMEHDASYLRKALLKSKLVTQAASFLDPQLAIAPWIFVCKGCEESHAEPIKALIDQTLKALLQKPFSHEEIEAALHQFELERSEISGDEGPFGLTLFFRAGLLVHHGVAPELGLLGHSLFSDLRAKCKDPAYLPSLIRKYLLENSHLVELILKPDPELEAKESEEELKKLQKIQEQLTPEEAGAIVTESKNLTAYQEKMEHQSLNCLPKLLLSDIPLKIEEFPLEEKKEGRLHLFHHSCFTNGLFYADLLFDLPEMAPDELSLLSLFARLLPELGSGGRSYEENLAKIQGHTGGISASLSLHVQKEDPDLCRPTFGLKGKALKRNSQELLTLMGDLIASPNWEDEERLKELLSQHVTSLQHRLTKNGLNYATQLALAPFSIPSFLFEKWHGLSYYQAILSSAKEMPALIQRLQKLREKLLSPFAFDLVLSCEEADASAIEALQKHLPQAKGASPWKNSFSLPKSASQARAISTPVASLVLGTKAVSYKNPAAPLLLLAAELLQNCTLHGEIREKGGAYGAGADYAPTTGNFTLYSYRDPHLAKSWKAFQKGLEKISQGRFTEEELEEAKLCCLQSFDAPVIPCSRAMATYAARRAGRTKQDRATFRAKILTATKEEVAQELQTSVLHQEKNFVAFLGEKLFQKEKRDLPFPIELLPV